jgi:hypothetical protein
MVIRCRHCGEYFYPDDETQELLFTGYIESYSVNTCDDCWAMIEYISDDISEWYSDPGL